jgi:hypothetical protein
MTSVVWLCGHGPLARHDGQDRFRDGVREHHEEQALSLFDPLTGF